MFQIIKTHRLRGLLFWLPLASFILMLGCQGAPKEIISDSPDGAAEPSVATTPSDVPTTPTVDPRIAVLDERIRELETDSSADEIAALREEIERLRCNALPEICDDGVDNDCDALVNCDDPECAGHVSCPTVGTTPDCGNGTIDEGEACDDGNTLADDGCDENCQREVTVITTLRPRDLEIRLPATAGTINAFTKDSGGYLLRVMGPAGGGKWVVGGRAANADVAHYESTTIDSAPTVVLDGNRKIHVFAKAAGQAGYQVFKCDADTMDCAVHPVILGLTMPNSYPALVFIPGKTASGGPDPSNDLIMGFYSIGNDSAYDEPPPISAPGNDHKLGWFSYKANNFSNFKENFVSRTKEDVGNCGGNEPDIEQSPTAVLAEIDGRKVLRVFARVGHGNIGDFSLTPNATHRLASGQWDPTTNDGDKFRCRRIERDPSGIGANIKPRFSSSPVAVWRGGNRIDLFATHQTGTFEDRPFLWGIELNGDGVPIFKDGTKWVQRLWDNNCELTKTVVGSGARLWGEYMTVALSPNDPTGDIDVFCRHDVGRTERSSTLMHLRIDKNGTVVSPPNQLSFPFLDAPAVVKDELGYIHLIGAAWIHGLGAEPAGLGADVGAPIYHRILAPPGGTGDWSVEPTTISSGYTVRNREGRQKNMVRAVYVPPAP